MRRSTVLVLAAATALALAFPAHAVASTQDRNVAFILSALGFEEAPEGLATVHAAGAVTRAPIEDALRSAAQRARNVDLAALVASASGEGPPVVVGDVWVIEIGGGSCPGPMSVASPVPAVDVHPQLASYAGGVGLMTWDTGIAYVTSWTTKASYSYVGGMSTTLGQSDFFCIEFFGLYFLFPLVDGVFVHSA